MLDQLVGRINAGDDQTVAIAAYGVFQEGGKFGFTVGDVGLLGLEAVDDFLQGEEGLVDLDGVFGGLTVATTFGAS